jgi:hypothetical protein
MIAPASPTQAEPDPLASPSAAGPRLAQRLIQLVRANSPALFILLVFIASLGVRFQSIDLAITADEGYWVQRTVRFGAAIEAADAAATFRAGHPGVTVMWTGFVGIGPSRLAAFLDERFAEFDDLERSPGYEELIGAARRAMALVAAGLLALTVALAWRLLGTVPALIGGALLALDPYIVGMTRLLHVDTLLAPLMAVSALAGLIYWTQARRWPYLLLSAGAGGLGLLTKAPAGYLPIFFALVGLVTLVGARRQGAPTAPGASIAPGPAITQLVVPLTLWGLTALVVYVALFPALWADPVLRVENLASFLLKTGLEPHPTNYFLGQVTRDDPGPFYYPLTIALRASPFAILGLAGLALPAHQEERRWGARWPLVYVALFIVLMSLAAKKLDRYMLPALLLLDLAAGIGLWRLASFLSATICRWLSTGPTAAAVDGQACSAHRTSVGSRLAFALLGACLIGQGTLLVLAEPYPIAAYNPLAGGAERAGRVIMLGWGEGLEQVTTFLNSQPNAERLLVATNYIHIVRPRLRGTSIPINLYFDNEQDQPLPTPDYVVLYINSVQRRQIPPIARRAILAGPPAFIAQVNGLDYAWVYTVPSSEPRITAPVPTDDPSEHEEG